MNLTALVVLVIVLLLGGFTLAWWLAARVKRSVDSASVPAGVGATRSVMVTPMCSELSASLSGEAILLKRDEAGLRFQVEGKRLAPLSVVSEPRASAALREAGAVVAAMYGERWVVLVRPSGADALSVSRLA